MFVQPLGLYRLSLPHSCFNVPLLNCEALGPAFLSVCVGRGRCSSHGAWPICYSYAPNNLSLTMSLLIAILAREQHEEGGGDLIAKHHGHSAVGDVCRSSMGSCYRFSSAVDYWICWFTTPLVGVSGGWWLTGSPSPCIGTGNFHYAYLCTCLTHHTYSRCSP